MKTQDKIKVTLVGRILTGTSNKADQYSYDEIPNGLGAVVVINGHGLPHGDVFVSVLALKNNSPHPRNIPHFRQAVIDQNVGFITIPESDTEALALNFASVTLPDMLANCSSASVYCPDNVQEFQDVANLLPSQPKMPL